ncbi:tRNA (adenosine(37)-N6)-threonylcarbamoyltransferase complex ATPase subunit type 1 TsaE [Candidatus Parcubacteria bacterium]|nr:tRNA (adenosine(37)-N6)-threonylcarbamoyltransferase complex ATPase subunit type 1 TsaE [Candidatus Parcubacteria bacterium]
MTIQILTTKEKETEKLGEILGKVLKNFHFNKKSLVFALEGDLGGGKTTFVRGVARGLGIKEKIISPSFVIWRKFEIPSQKSFQFLYHFDLYRLKEKEIQSLKLKELFSQKKTLFFIEWAGKGKKFLPKNKIWIFFTFKGKNKREIKIILEK